MVKELYLLLFFLKSKRFIVGRLLLNIREKYMYRQAFISGRLIYKDCIFNLGALNLLAH